MLPLALKCGAVHKGAAMLAGGYTRLLTVLAGFAACSATSARAAESQTRFPSQLEEVLVTARQALENLEEVPVAVTTLSAERIARYDVSSLEKLAATLPDLILTRGNSGSGLDISLRGIGPNFSSIGIEQSVAVVVDGVYYGQGRVIDESFVDLASIEVLKGPQALFFGKNSTAGVISITTADPQARLEARVRVGYEFATQHPRGEVVLSGPVTEDFGLRLVLSGRDNWGGYVHNEAPAGTYTTIDAATFVPTAHNVPPPDNRDLPRESTALGRLTATYRPSDNFRITVKASAGRDEQGGTSWNNKLWKCPAGNAAFPGAVEGCGEGFRIEQNPAPADIAATRPDMGREGGQLYTLYRSQALTSRIEMSVAPVSLTSLTNYQHFDYTSNSDYDFTGVPVIWADQHNSYRAVSQELRARTDLAAPVNVLAGLYYQSSAVRFAQAAVFFGSENSLASPSERYVSVLKDSATHGRTLAGYAQLTWAFPRGWELAAGARYTHETKSSYFIQPYVNPFFAGLYAANERLSSEQRFHNVSPEVTLSWKPDPRAMLYVAFRTGYKSGGFSNSADDVVNSGGVEDLSFRPETARGVEAGLKATLLERTLRLNADAYRYRFADLQVDFFNAQNFALITTNAGAAISEGVELQAEYLPPVARGVRLHGSVAYNLAHYERYSGPCYAGQTQAQGCNLTGPAPDNAALQNLSGKPTADSPKWTGTVGAEYEQRLGAGIVLACSTDVRLSSRYSVSPFAQPLAVQSAYANLDAAVSVATSDHHWQLALIGRNLTDNFVVTYASDAPSTGSAAGGQTGQLADQVGLFAPARTVELQLTYER
jgi:outer membrane receptor protein involved in Fe transport